MEKLLMARFDVYPNPGQSAAGTPYLLEVQSDLLDGLSTTVVVPLCRENAFAKIKLPMRLTPALRINGENFLMETPKLAAVPRKMLKNPITNLIAEQSSISNALDFLFQGY